MALQLVTWTSCDKLACGKNVPAPVILCVNPNLVAPHMCDEETEQTFEWSHIYGMLLAARCVCTGGWEYIIQYDDTQLVEDGILFQNDIVGAVCVGCWSQFVTDIAGEEVLVEYNEEEGEVTITSQHGCSTTFPVGGGGAGGDWLLLGNAGTVEGTDFLGTTDDVPLELRVNDARISQFFSNGDVITGLNTNSSNYLVPLGPIVDFTAAHNFMGSGNANELWDAGFCGIGSGAENRMGVLNTDDDTDSSLFHLGNYIGGGETNGIWIFNDDVDNQLVIGWNFIGGGYNNAMADSSSCGIGSGTYNSIGSNGQSIRIDNFTTSSPGNSLGPWLYDYIGGGYFNQIFDGHYNSTLGGWFNTNNGSLRSTIGAGAGAQIENEDSSGILSGYNNWLECSGASWTDIDTSPSDTAGTGNVINGGVRNKISDGFCSSILGGAMLNIGQASVGYQSPLALTWNPEFGSIVDIEAMPESAFFGDVDLIIGNVANQARKLVLYEPNTDLDYSSAHYTSLRAQSQAAHIDYVMPAAAGIAGQRLTISGVVGTTVTLGWAA